MTDTTPSQRAREVAANILRVRGTLLSAYLDGEMDGGDHVRIAEAALAQGRADERRAVVAYLKGQAESGHPAFAATRHFAADAIERSDHTGTGG